MGKLIVLMIVGVLLFVFLGWCCSELWNWLMPYLFGVPEIDLWQALGLMALSSILLYRHRPSSSK